MSYGIRYMVNGRLVNLLDEFATEKQALVQYNRMLGYRHIPSGQTEEYHYQKVDPERIAQGLTAMFLIRHHEHKEDEYIKVFLAHAHVVRFIGSRIENDREFLKFQLQDGTPFVLVGVETAVGCVEREIKDELASHNGSFTGWCHIHPSDDDRYRYTLEFLLTQDEFDLIGADRDVDTTPVSNLENIRIMDPSTIIIGPNIPLHYGSRLVVL